MLCVNNKYYIKSHLQFSLISVKCFCIKLPPRWYAESDFSQQIEQLLCIEDKVQLNVFPAISVTTPRSNHCCNVTWQFEEKVNELNRTIFIKKRGSKDYHPYQKLWRHGATVTTSCHMFKQILHFAWSTSTHIWKKNTVESSALQ